MKNYFSAIASSLLCFSALCLSTLLALADNDDAAQAKLNAGYFLLHNLLDQESGVPFLLDIKTAPPEIQRFAIEISKSAKEGEAQMERMRDHDPAMNWDRNPLPAFERDVRSSITDEKEHQLLFGTKGPDFARAFLVSQAEAAKYAANIAKVLAEQDPHPDHQQQFERISAQWHDLYNEDFRLLRGF